MINKIIGNISISDWQDAKYAYKREEFDEIFTVAKDSPFIGNHYYPMIDGTYSENYRLMTSAINDLLSQDKQKKILVHCVSGFSRSTTVVIGYMINRYNINNRHITVDESLSHIKEIRPLANPSQELLRLLKMYEKEILTENNIY